MRKIKTVFKIAYTEKGCKGIISDEVNDGCEWVLAGEGWPEIKLDGTACLIMNKLLYKRYDAKHGKPAPPGFIPCMPTADEVTGHWPGWILVGTEPESKWHVNAFSRLTDKAEGTYELIGRHINSNPYKLETDHLVKHGYYTPSIPIERTFKAIKAFLTMADIEGLVFHHEDGRMAKIRRRDFGLQWPQ